MYGKVRKYSPKVTKLLAARTFVYIFVHAADICIDSSQDCLAHTLARLSDMCKSTSDLISPIPAHYDFLKTFFRMTVEPSYGSEGGRFRMTDGLSYGHERVKCRLTKCRMDKVSTRQNVEWTKCRPDKMSMTQKNENLSLSQMEERERELSITQLTFALTGTLSTSLTKTVIFSSFKLCVFLKQTVVG